MSCAGSNRHGHILVNEPPNTSAPCSIRCHRLRVLDDRHVCEKHLPTKRIFIARRALKTARTHTHVFGANSFEKQKNTTPKKTKEGTSKRILKKGSQIRLHNSIRGSEIRLHNSIRAPEIVMIHSRNPKLFRHFVALLLPGLCLILYPFGCAIANDIVNSSDPSVFHVVASEQPAWLTNISVDGAIRINDNDVPFNFSGKQIFHFVGASGLLGGEDTVNGTFKDKVCLCVREIGQCRVGYPADIYFASCYPDLRHAFRARTCSLHS